MRTTLYEIASQSGVSISTVSRVINGDLKKPASKATTERVLAVARELGYFSYMSQVPKVNQLKTIVCLLSSTAYSYADFFYAQILKGIEEVARSLGYEIVQKFADQTADPATLLSSTQCDGIILMGRNSKHFTKQLHSYCPNIVYAGLNRIDCDIDQIICDAYDAMKASVEYLVDIGHEKLGYIGNIADDRDPEINEQRFTAFCNVLHKHNLYLDMRFCKDIIFKTEYANLAALELIKEAEWPDAIVCATDNTAIGVIGALHSCGLRVPDDISVIGLDDVDISQFIEPKLTTSHMHKKELGRIAVKVLHDRIEHGHSIPLLVKLPHELIIRNSCCHKH